ncbi:Cro/Cl family transcriptional regulator [Chania multitudinisentens RB-25]|uniref:Cro/Cl family transcriptional regulator n=1 Tax=Chania multitudinisentens RB-25 TaxID=1441930 RepID=W0LH51_9GAMM|nr:ornithine cyclodeaminase family protein [Chania multitudinisentens]AHG21709.1 Cro/Cl family transcriptional regulator [Chania multitudinisentens RB-25]
MLFIGREKVANCLTPSLCLQLSREAFSLASKGKVKQTLRSVIASDDGCLMGTMPAYISEGPYAGFGLKTVKVDFNHTDQRTSHEGCILLYDADGKGEIALVDAGVVTEFRTAAASALATQLLAAPDATRLAILGTGVQARKHAQMMISVRAIEHITVWGRCAESTDSFASWCRENLKLPVTIAASPTQAVKHAEIICTVTASREAFLHSNALPLQCHINAVGASAIGFQEISSELYSHVELYVDYREAVWNASTCLIKAQEQGYLQKDNMGTEIGELLIQKKAFIQPQTKRTLFKSVGIAAQDLVFARAIVNMQRTNLNGI